MYVKVRAGGADVSLEEPDDCTRFSVVVEGAGDAPSVGAALEARGAGRMAEDDHAWIDTRWVTQAATGRVGDGWPQRFAAMLEYARTNGWLDDEGSSIRAHVEAAP